MKTFFLSLSLGCLIAGTAFALTEIANVSKETADEMGIAMKTRKNGDAGNMVWLEFKKEGVLKKFSFAQIRMSKEDGSHLFSAQAAGESCRS